MERLTLADALASGRIEEFAAQAEAAGIGPADRTLFEALVGKVTAPRREGQTFHSRGDGSKRGK